jgi:hypothetical protein
VCNYLLQQNWCFQVKIITFDLYLLKLHVFSSIISQIRLRKAWWCPPCAVTGSCLGYTNTTLLLLFSTICQQTKVRSFWIEAGSSQETPPFVFAFFSNIMWKVFSSAVIILCYYIYICLAQFGFLRDHLTSASYLNIFCAYTIRCCFARSMDYPCRNSHAKERTHGYWRKSKKKHAFN